MDISMEKALERVARLAGLELSEEKKEVLFSDLSRIVPYMERITELDTEIPDEAEPEPDAPVLREDVSVDSGLTDAILQQAPKPEGGMFTVPRTVE